MLSSIMCIHYYFNTRPYDVTMTHKVTQHEYILKSQVSTADRSQRFQSVLLQSYG